MAEKLKVELTDEEGNIYYLHTDASVVYCSDGTTVEDKLNSKISTDAIIQNTITNATDKVPSAAVAKNLQDQLNNKLNISSNAEARVGSLHIGSGDSYMYTESNGCDIIFRFQDNNGRTIYTNMLKLAEGLSPRGKVASTSNINDIVLAGMYTISSEQHPANSPCGYGVLIVFNSWYAYIAQLVIDVNGVIYHRIRNESGFWTSWFKHTTTKI